MFDPERDEAESHRTFYLRILTTVAIAIAGGAALLPSMIGFNAGVDADHSCVAIRDGWHADRGPNASEQDVLNAPLGHPTAQQMAAITRANARLEWAQGVGACVPESRHRLIVSGAAVGGLAVIATAAGLVRARRVRVAKDRHDNAPASAPSIPRLSRV